MIEQHGTANFQALFSPVCEPSPTEASAAENVLATVE